MPHESQSRYEFARHIAWEAGKLTLRYFDTAVVVDRKDDMSPVTVADREAEKLLREYISREFPDDGIVGEEFGEQAGSSGYRWIVDPIDGTKSFISGVPLYGTLVGVEYDGRSIIGVFVRPRCRRSRRQRARVLGRPGQIEKDRRPTFPRHCGSRMAHW